jgi:hypothetical protein
MQPMYYIGLDVHKRKISYCVKDGSGKIHTEGSISATRLDLDPNGLSGVTLKLSKHGTELRGWAHPHFDFPPPPPRLQHVTARRIGCGHSQ